MTWRESQGMLLLRGGKTPATPSPGSKGGIMENIKKLEKKVKQILIDAGEEFEEHYHRCKLKPPCKVECVDCISSRIVEILKEK